MPRDPVRGKEALSQEAGDPGCRLPWGPLTSFPGACFLWGSSCPPEDPVVVVVVVVVPPT